MIDKLRYGIEEVKENGTDTQWWRWRFLERLYRPVAWPLYSKLHGRNEGMKVIEEDWDVLIVLDSCRYDLFEEVVDLDQFDSYSRVDSLGGATKEWAQNNFPPDGTPAHTDTVFVNSNPKVSKNASTPFAKFYDVWRDGFSEELNTVPPDPMTKTAIEAAESYPEKRLIIHYLQPHIPFMNNPELQFTRFIGKREDKDARTAWEAVRRGIITKEELWEGYRDNLSIVMSHVNQLVEEFSDRKIVVTSDHGNLIGERPDHYPLRMYGHEAHFRHEYLTRVPWAVVDNRDSNQSEQQGGEDSIQDRLSALGYM